jgi:hypothetical protein
MDVSKCKGHKDYKKEFQTFYKAFLQRHNRLWNAGFTESFNIPRYKIQLYWQVKESVLGIFPESLVNVLSLAYTFIQLNGEFH